MPMDRYWQTVTDSLYPWEDDALAFIRERLPDDERYRAWANFEFITRDGHVYEVDLLVVTPAGVFLVEIKSWPGKISGDAGTWRWTHEGRTRSRDNPRVLANRKAKILKGLLASQRALARHRSFFVDALVFLSHEDVRIDLDERARIGVWPRARIVDALARYEGRPRVDRPLAAALARAMEEIGVRPSLRRSRFGDHQLRELLHETDEYQEWRVEKESFEGLERRARLYPVAVGIRAEERARRVRAAQREFSFLRDLRHPGILWPVEYLEDERGPVLFFDYPGDSVRLDHYLAQEHERLTVDQRLALLRQVFEAVAFAHDRRLVHRALAPSVIEVEDPASAFPHLRIGDWHRGRRLSSGSRLSATDHLGAGFDEPRLLYLAPETRTRENVAEYDEPKLDVFSLGALTYHVFTGAPPASDLLELEKKLREGPGLKLSSVVDGAVTALQVLVADATHPNVVERVASVRDLLEYLDVVEEELTEPDAAAFADPRTARGGDRLPGGFEVVQGLGSGSVARVFRVRHEGRTAVLKVAHEREHNARIADEYQVLEKLRHQHVVAPLELVDVGGRRAILMEDAGEVSLEKHLREVGALEPETLRRLGDELLQVVDHLEGKGLAHRDLKPANLALRLDGRGRPHVVVFDFSLSRAPAESLRAGTAGYLDPFVRRRGRWDVHAERFSAAVTLYEMATGARPVWGDGRSDPALLEDAEPRIHSGELDAFGPERAEALADFFRRALAPELKDRFDTCEEMLDAWRQAFAAVPQGEEEAFEEPRPARPAESRDRIPESWGRAGLDDGVDGLELSKRARGALERAGVTTVRAALGLSLADVAAQRNVGRKTHQEVARLYGTLAERFPDALPEPAPEPEAGEEEVDDLQSVDRLFEGLVPRAEAPSAEVVRRLLGLGDAESEPWPSQTEVADELDVTRARVGQVTARARERWRKQKPLTALRAEVAGVLAQHGGVMTVAELAEAVLFLCGSTRRGPERRRRANAVVRTALEAEKSLENPRFDFYRRSESVFAAVPGDLGPALATYARELGQRADQLAAEDPLPSAARALEALEAVSRPPGTEPLPEERLRNLASAASRGAALSARGELYPRGVSAERVLRLARGTLLGARDVDVDGVHRRVLGRFPETAPLPGRPELDALLREAGTGLVWWSDRECYGPDDLPVLSSDTAHGAEEAGPAPETARFESRLERAASDRGFLVLTVSPRLAERSARALAERFGVETRSFERLLIEAMQRVARREGADWNVVLEADASPKAGDNWNLLLDLVRHHALPEVEADLEKTAGTVLLTRPGLLVRYDALACLERLREKTGSAFGLWLLVPTGEPAARPTLDGHALPILGPGDWASVPDSWVETR